MLILSACEEGINWEVTIQYTARQYSPKTGNLINTTTSTEKTIVLDKTEAEIIKYCEPMYYEANTYENIFKHNIDKTYKQLDWNFYC